MASGERNGERKSGICACGGSKLAQTKCTELRRGVPARLLCFVVVSLCFVSVVGWLLVAYFVVRSLVFYSFLPSRCQVAGCLLRCSSLLFYSFLSSRSPPTPCSGRHIPTCMREACASTPHTCKICILYNMSCLNVHACARLVRVP